MIFQRLDKVKSPSGDTPAKLTALTLSHQKKKDILTMRRYFAIWTMVLLSLWMIFSACVIFENNISDTVKIVLLSTTTVNLIALPLVIIKSLFDSNSN